MRLVPLPKDCGGAACTAPFLIFETSLKLRFFCVVTPRRTLDSTFTARLLYAGLPDRQFIRFWKQYPADHLIKTQKGTHCIASKNARQRIPFTDRTGGRPAPINKNRVLFSENGFLSASIFEKRLPANHRRFLQKIQQKQLLISAISINESCTICQSIFLKNN